MRVTNMIPQAQYAMQQSQLALSAALQQVSTGLRVNQLSDDPSASANLVSLLAASANVDQYTSNVSATLSQMQSADSAISSVITSMNTAITVGTAGANGVENAANRQAMAAQVQGILAGVVGQANTSYMGVYLFAGSASSTAPFVPVSSAYTSTQGSVAPPLTATQPLTAGSVTTVSDASTGKSFTFTVIPGQPISALSIAIAAAAADGTLSAGTTAQINSTGQLEIDSSSSIAVTSNDPTLGAMNAAPVTAFADTYLYVGNSSVNHVQVGDSISVATNVPGDQMFTSGGNVVGSLSRLITALKSGTSAQIGAAASAVAAALTSLNQQRVPFDNTMSSLNSQESYLGRETLTLTTQQNSLIGISLADAATNLSQAELTNSAVLAAAAKSLPQTLLDYLK